MIRIFMSLFFLWSCNVFAFKPSLIEQYLPKNPIILDCGANDGASSIELLRQYPGATVLAVEADPDLIPLLQENTRGFSQIHPFYLALASYDGETTFYENQDKAIYKSQGSIYPPSKDRWYWPEIKLNKIPIHVPCQTLDSFCHSNGFERCDFLYLDMQGGELGMLKHSPHILSKVSVIISEVSYERIYENCPTYSELKQFLESQGFKEIEHMAEHPSYGNALFVRE